MIMIGMLVNLSTCDYNDQGTTRTGGVHWVGE